MLTEALILLAIATAVLALALAGVHVHGHRQAQRRIANAIRRAGPRVKRPVGFTRPSDPDAPRAKPQP